MAYMVILILCFKEDFSNFGRSGGLASYRGQDLL